MPVKGQLFTAKDRVKVDDSQVLYYVKIFILYGKSQAKLSIFQVSFASFFLSRSYICGSGLPHIFYHTLQFTVSVKTEVSAS